MGLFEIEIKRLKEENRRLSQELKQRLFELSILYDISNSISYTLDYDNFLHLVMDSLHRLVDYDLCISLIALEDQKKAKMIIRLAHPLRREIVEEAKGKVIKVLGSLRGLSFKEEDISLQIKGDFATDEAPLERLRSSFDVPLFVRDKPAGLLNVASTQDIAYSDEAIKLFYTLASQASIAVERLQGVLAAEKSKMKVMVEGMSEGVIMFDEQDRLAVINITAREMLGISQSQIDTFFLLGYLKNMNLLKSLNEVKQYRRHPYVCEITLTKPYPRIIHSEAISIEDEEGKFLGVSILLRDVTREREIDQMKDEFISLVSHELRTPLAAMKAATENLLDGIVGEISSGQKDYLLIVQRNIDRLGRLISDLLDISRIEAGRLQLNKRPTDLISLIREVLQFLQQAAAEKKITLLSRLPETLPVVNIDPDKIMQVLINLIGNALKFSPLGAEVIICAKVCGNQEILIEVKDTGPGISCQDLKKIFNKFYQASASQGQRSKGTGLGLAICKGIVEKHKGRIWVESELGKGSKFTFSLPLH
jgi:signal transduction histidine kinase